MRYNNEKFFASVDSPNTNTCKYKLNNSTIICDKSLLLVLKNPTSKKKKDLEGSDFTRSEIKVGLTPVETDHTLPQYEWNTSLSYRSWLVSMTGKKISLQSRSSQFDFPPQPYQRERVKDIGLARMIVAHIGHWNASVRLGQSCPIGQFVRSISIQKERERKKAPISIFLLFSLLFPPASSVYSNSISPPAASLT